MRENKFSTSATYLLIFGSIICWGSSYVFTKIALQWAVPIVIIFIRLLISCALMWTLIAIFYRKEKIERKNWKYLLLLAFFEPFLYFLGETYGLERVSPVFASLIISTIPVFTAIISKVFFKAKLSTLNFVGIGISFCGVIAMIVDKNMQIIVDAWGLFLLILAVLAAVGYGLVLNIVAQRIHPVWVIAIQNTFGMCFFFPLFLILREPVNYQLCSSFDFFANATPFVVFWTCIIILAVFCSTVAFLLYSIVVKRIGVAKASVFTNISPFFTAMTAYFILGEVFNLQKMIAMVVVVFGVILTQLDKKKLKTARHNK